MRIVSPASNRLTKVLFDASHVKLNVVDYQRILNAIQRRVRSTGHTMTGPLIGHSDAPTTNREYTPKVYVNKIETEIYQALTSHKDTQSLGIHGSTNEANANKLIHRDGSGRARVQNPSHDLDIVNKRTLAAAENALSQSLQTHIDDGSDPHPNASAYEPTANKLAIRNNYGRLQVADAAHDLDAVNRRKFNEWADSKVKAHNDKTTGIHGATSESVPSRLVIRDSNGRFKASDPVHDYDVVNKRTLSNLSGNVQTHIDDDSNPHPNATAVGATANKLVIRDGAGRINIVAAVSGGQATTLTQVRQEIDQDVKTHSDKTGSSAHGATSAPNPNTIMARDASARVQVNNPAADKDAANKIYVDAVRQSFNDHVNKGTNPHPEATSTGPDANQLMLRDSAGRSQVADPHSAFDIVNKRTLETQINSVKGNYAAVNPGSAKNGDIRVANSKLYGYMNGWRQIWPATYS